MIEILILVILLLFYIIPYKGFVKLSENEQKIIDDYKHVSLKITDESENLLADDLGVDDNLDLSLDSEDNLNDVPTLNVLGDLDSSNNNEDDYSDIQIKDLL